MASSVSAPGRLVLALVVELVVAVGVGLVVTNAVMRPGCSLLPVAVPRDSPSGLSVPISPEQACAILGRSVYVPDLPDGVRLIGRSASTGQPPGAPRMVRMTFARGERNVATLDVASTRGLRIFSVPPMSGSVDSVHADIEVTRDASRGYDDVVYHWLRNDIAYTLHIGLMDGITRQDADAMAASVR